MHWRSTLFLGPLLIIAPVVISGCASFATPATTPADSVDPLAVLQARVDTVGDSLQKEVVATAVQSVLQGQAGLYNSKLTYPLSDYGTRRTILFGQYQANQYNTGDVLTIPGGDQSTALVAIAQGTVKQVTSTNNLGQFVVLEFLYQGSTYHAVYSHLTNATVTVAPGEALSLGDTIATIQGLEDSSFHFTVYKYTGIERFAEAVTTPVDLQWWVNPFDFLRQAETF